MIQVQIAQFCVLKPDGLGHAVKGVIDFLAIQQCPNNTDVFGEVLDASRPLSHSSHSCVAGANTHEGAPRRQAGGSGDTVSCHWREA